MENIYSSIRKLAKSNKYQNLFNISKDLRNIIFRNRTDFSQIQIYFINYLYMYENLNRDIVLEKVSEHVLDCELYEDSYSLWKKEKNKEDPDKPEDTKQKDLHLILDDKIIFPARKTNG